MRWAPLPVSWLRLGIQASLLVPAMLQRLSKIHLQRPFAALAIPGIVAFAAAPSAAAQTELVFSLDYHGPLIGTPTIGGPLTHGDLLVRSGQSVFGPALPPDILYNGGQVGLPGYSGCVGVQGGIPCPVEIDAMSYGFDRILTPDPLDTYAVYFTVDEYAEGDPSLLAGPPGNLRTEAQAFDSSGDVYTSGLLQPGPIPIPSPGPGRRNHILFDGDGQPTGIGPFAPSLGLVEPNDPNLGLPGALQDTGSHVDAITAQQPVNPLLQTLYFSVDGPGSDTTFGYQHTGTNGSLGFSPGDILASQNGVISLFIPFDQLGLGMFDDVDALIFHDNGNGVYDPWLAMFDWVPTFPTPGPGTLAMPGPPPSDLLLFSVKRGSPLVGTLDASGTIIEEGDLLLPPPGGSGLPLIYVPGEAMGLKTGRSFPGERGDDLSGATILGLGETFLDCNSNGVEDGVDIALGTSTDTNLNGVPDECEPPGAAWCFCTPAVDPCANDYAAGGCENVTGVGGILDGTGSSSLFLDDLVLTSTQLPTNNFALTFVGQGATSVTLGNGVRCVDSGGSSSLYRRPISATGPGGMCVESDIVGWSCTDPLLPAAACIMLGSTWSFQTWYRDNIGVVNLGPCGMGSNLTNAWEVTFTP